MNQFKPTDMKTGTEDFERMREENSDAFSKFIEKINEILQEMKVMYEKMNEEERDECAMILVACDRRVNFPDQIVLSGGILGKPVTVFNTYRAFNDKHPEFKAADMLIDGMKRYGRPGHN